MDTILKAESTLTNRYQTTIPEAVRRTLKLGKHDKIAYTVGSDGQVSLSRVTPPEQADPALSQFLNFLASDIACHPERLQAFDANLAHRLQSLVGDVEVDLDAPLSADDE